jgi:hypothetical protein
MSEPIDDTGPSDSRNVAHCLCEAVDEFLEAAPTSSGWDALRHGLLTRVRALDPLEAFNGLFWVLEHRAGYQEQWIAGDLLLNAGIHCPLTLQEFLERVISNLNPSADTVIKYLTTAFEPEPVVKTVQDMRKSAIDTRQVARLDCVQYWLHVHPGRGA